MLVRTGVITAISLIDAQPRTRRCGEGFGAGSLGCERRGVGVVDQGECGELHTDIDISRLSWVINPGL